MLTTTDGKAVTIKSAKHMDAHADVAPFLKDALAKAEIPAVPGSVVVVTVDMGKVVGRSGCVETTDADIVTYERRPGRRFASRCVRGKLGAETSLVTLIIRVGTASHTLITAWIGSPAPREPHDPTMSAAEREASKQFWANHALVVQ